MDHNDPLQSGTLPPQSPTPGPDFSSANPSSWLRHAFFNERELRSGWRLLIFVVLWACIFAGLYFLLRPSRVGTSRLSAQSLILNEVAMLGAALIAAAIMGFAEKRSFADYALPWRLAFRSQFWWGAFWGGAGIVGLLFLMKLGHGFYFGSIGGELGPPLFFAAGLWALGSILTGINEEFFLRGYALFTLTTGIGFWPAAIILSIVFGALHMGNPGEDWPGIAAVVLIGLFFCFTLRRTGSLWLAIGFHAMWDYCENFVFTVPDSGIMTNNHLFRSSLHGSRWITGGSAGPEGSLLVFVVIGALFVLIHFLYPEARFGVNLSQRAASQIAAVTGAS